MRFTPLFCLMIASSALLGCPPEYEMHSLLEPSLLQRVGCDAGEPVDVADEDRPVAICDASATEVFAVHEGLTLDASESYDPGGHDLIGYDWGIVERPHGSSARLGPGEPIRPFKPDLVGDYVAQLQVINDQCVLSDPCELVVSAIPREHLWVEMYWSHPGEDMDLHLIREDARARTYGDCSFENCIGEPGLDWDQRGVPSDDPRLDLDDIEDVGPENINITRPAASWYTVMVHDYPGSVRRRPTDVTVRIYLDGERLFEETRTIEGEDHDEYFAEIDWVNREIYPL